MRMHLASRLTPRSFKRAFKNVHTRAGKVTLVTVLTGAVIFSMAGFAFFEVNVPIASADDVTTSVTVLNTPPTWNSGQEARESVASATSTPTNAGDTVTWIATASDSSSDDYYLLICKTNGTPTPNGSAAPDCAGGVANQWAVSSATVTNTQASAATSTIDTFPFDQESNDWYAWICDDNATLPRCNSTFETGATFGDEDQASPFVVNHVPVFSAVINDSPANPGETVTWTSTASDTDSLGTADTVQLFVCRNADFDGSACGAGGTWAVSTFAASNPATTTTIEIPTQDDDYSAYVYIVDNHGLQATSTIQAFDSEFVVSNVAPEVGAATISLVDTDDVGNLELTVPASTSGPFKVEFEVSDDNGCQNAASGDEIASTIANIYRSGVTQASCQISGDYNANSCYPTASPLADITCTQDALSCSGDSDSSATFTCSFSLWYIADPTDTSTPWTAENWVASVQASDDNFATSTLEEATSGNELVSFLAFDVTESAIPYGALEPGQNTGTLASTTDLIAIGNVGLDEDLYGDTMCPTWSSPDSCDSDGINPGSDITVDNQQFATSSVAYDGAGAFPLTSSSTPSQLAINVPKTTATSTPETGITYWGIEIPGTITTAGNYTGQNTITAIKSDISAW